MELKLNGAEKQSAEAHIASAIDAQLKTAHCDGLSEAMRAVWDERGKYPVLSETFFALTKVWEALCEQRRLKESKGVV